MTATHVPMRVSDGRLDDRNAAASAGGSGAIPPGRIVVDHLPQLARHQGTPPDLVLQWGTLPRSGPIDVVVHLHGHSAHGRRMNLIRDMVPVSGLNLTDPAHRGMLGRRRPTLLVLSRGHFYGGRSGRGYSFPALQVPDGIAALVDDALRRLAAATGIRATRGRLILTAHSGGGSALMTILRHVDPDEVHSFDALYSDPEPLIGWARRRKEAGRGALRVLFRPAEPTVRNSLRVAAALGTPTPRFRVEQTQVPHMDIPQTFGWRLLADASADLPGAASPQRHGRARPGARPAREESGEVGNPGQDGTLCDRIARVALREFRRWRPGGGPPLTERIPAASPILREYYRVGVHETVTDERLQDKHFQEQHPWSAVFISYVMRIAGAGPAFRYSTGHWVYIRAARQNRFTNNTANPFWAFRATEIAPKVGDLVCKSRNSSGATYETVGDPGRQLAHCDIVVEVQPGRIRVIGGNVGQTVGERWLNILPNGRLSLTGRQIGYFAVVRCGSRVATAPASRFPVSQTAALAPSDLSGRVARVMYLLVRRYGYPVNGAAGLVGNLIAESQVMPNRIEGSKQATPMRTADFSGRVRDFTPDEVRDRTFARRQGPRLPGIGIAQWTSPARRAGLFQHTVNGRRLGSAILSDLDAQVDYLVTELHREFAGVDRTLRAPGVTVDQAADAVVLRFERPGAVLNKPVTHPDVQRVLRQRRTLAAKARQFHRATQQN